jgi:hypothetical protein
MFEVHANIIRYNARVSGTSFKTDRLSSQGGLIGVYVQYISLYSIVYVGIPVDPFTYYTS